MGRLRFTDLRCSNLINRDTFGKSDPYCIVRIGRTEQKTEVIDGNLNPTWSGYKKWKPFDVSMNDEIEFMIWDEDSMNDDFLGRGVTTVGKILKKMTDRQRKQSVGQTVQMETDSWVSSTGIELGPRPNESKDKSLYQKHKSFGKIFFAATYEEEGLQPPSPNQAPHSSLRSVSEDSITRDDTERSVKIKSVVSFSDNAPSKEALQQRRATYHGKSFLKIISIRGEDLIAQDRSGTSDPYLELSLPDDKSFKTLKTDKIEKTLNPTWEIDPSVWSIDLEKGVLPKLDFTVWDYDRFGSNELIGFASVQLENSHFRSTSDVCLELSLGPRPANVKEDQKLIKLQRNPEKKKSGSFGMIAVTMQYVGNIKQLEQLRVSEENKHLVAKKPLFDHFSSSLYVRVLKGLDFLPVDGKDCDAYLEITAKCDQGQPALPVVVTQKVPNTTSPVWNHTYIREERADNVAGVTFVVKNKKTIGSDTVIGYGELPIQFGHGSKNEKCTVSLKSRPGSRDDDQLLQKYRRNHFGTLLVDYDYQVSPTGVVTPMVQQGSGCMQFPHRKRLHILLNTVKNIPVHDRHSVVAVLKIGQREDSSREFDIDPGSQSTVKHTFELDIQSSYLRGTITIISKGMFSNDVYGVGEVLFDLTDSAGSQDRRESQYDTRRGSRDPWDRNQSDNNVKSPKSMEVELQPGDDESCLVRLNKQGNPTNLGTVTLAYQVLDVDQSIDRSLLERSASNPQHHNQPDRQAATYRTEDQPAYGSYSRGNSVIDRGFGSSVQQTGTGYTLNLIIDKAENLTPRSAYEVCDPFLIIKRSGTEDEFKTCTVNQNTAPRWHHTIDMNNVYNDEEIVITAFDSDPSGYDSFLGEAIISVSDLINQDTSYSLRKGQRDLQGRRSADGTSSDTRSWYGSNNKSDFQSNNLHTSKIYFKWKIIPTEERQRMLQKLSAKPCILDLVIHSAHELSTASFNTSNDFSSTCLRYARITVNDSEERKTEPNETARWEQGFQFGVTKDLNIGRLSLWEDQTYGPRFLGETTIEFSSSGYPQGQESLQLQPRPDPHYNADDVRLLNSRDAGLGTLNISWAFRDNLQRRQFPMEPYIVIVNIIEASNVSPAPLHYITCSIKGTNSLKYSQVERGHHPKFRTQFEFVLHHDYEDIKIKLFGRRADGAPDENIGSISFPVGPSQSQAAVTEKTWCDLKVKSHQKSGDSPQAMHAPPRLLYMWKSVVDPALQQKLLQQQQQKVSERSVGSMGSQKSIGDRDIIASLQQQVSALTAQNRELQRTVEQLLHQNDHHPRREGGRSRTYQHRQPDQLSIPDSRGSSVQRKRFPYRPSSPSPPRNSGLYALESQIVVVEHQETRRRATLTLSLPSDVHTIIDKAKRSLDLPINSSYVLRWRGRELSPNDDLEDLMLTDNDILVISRSDQFMTKRSPRYGRGRDPQGASLPNNHNLSSVASNNQAVLSRLRKASTTRQEHLTVALWMSSAHDGIVISTCSNSGFPGFARAHPTLHLVTEVIIQGEAVDIVPLVFSIVNDSRVPMEVIEVKGYIPLLTTNFKIAADQEDGARMWENCCRSANIPGAGNKAWFYRSTEGIQEGLPGVLVIDERA